MNEDGSLTDMPLKDFKGSLFVFSPVPLVILLKQGMKRFCYIGKPRNPVSIEIDKTDELVDASHSSRLLPLYYVCNLLSSISNPSQLTLTLRNSIFFRWNSHFFALQKSFAS
jgi:hypothetical protein